MLFLQTTVNDIVEKNSKLKKKLIALEEYMEEYKVSGTIEEILYIINALKNAQTHKEVESLNKMFEKYKKNNDVVVTKLIKDSEEIINGIERIKIKQEISKIENLLKKVKIYNSGFDFFLTPKLSVGKVQIDYKVLIKGDLEVKRKDRMPQVFAIISEDSEYNSEEKHFFGKNKNYKGVTFLMIDLKENKISYSENRPEIECELIVLKGGDIVG